MEQQQQQQWRSCPQVQTIKIKGKKVILPRDMWPYGWSIHRYGYVYYTGRGGRYPRGVYLHRAVINRLIAPKTLPPDMHVHHIDGNKLNNCTCNLIICSPDFNPTPVKQHPYTGRWISIEKYLQIIGKL